LDEIEVSGSFPLKSANAGRQLSAAEMVRQVVNEG
jgi:hypothetical protein